MGRVGIDVDLFVVEWGAAAGGLEDGFGVVAETAAGAGIERVGGFRGIGRRFRGAA